MGRAPTLVHTPADAEMIAETLRSHWQLGTAPIANLLSLLEDHGVKVDYLATDADGFDALCCRAGGVPAILLKQNVPWDRQRFSVAHELGHAVMAVDGSGPVDEEALASRFAGAFLVPYAAAVRELGAQRTDISRTELQILKHKYGLSMQAWLRRAQELSVISERCFREVKAEFSAHGWLQKEPGDEVLPETPQRLRTMVAALLAEELVTVSRAAELLGKSRSRALAHRRAVR